MEKKENPWTKNKRTGDFAESIIKDLINSMEDWNCVRYGMEHQIGALKESLRNNHTSNASLLIRSMPDLVAINKQTNKVHFIEVKFRSSIYNKNPKEVLYRFGYARMRNYLKFWPETYLVVVNRDAPFFSVISLKDVEWYKHFHSRIKYNEETSELWNFKGIKKEIKDLFPELAEDKIKEAIKRISQRTK